MTYNPFSLAGKTILVTGASSGIGRATAIESSRLGANVCITGRNQQRLAETFLLLEGEGHSQFTAELTDSNQVEYLVESLPHIDGVVHSAGVVPLNHVPSAYVEESDILDVFKSNLLQIVNLNAMLLQSRKICNGASIVHISSLVVKYPLIGYSPYSISKGALLPYSKVLATELVTKSIRVNTVLPAMVDTAAISALDHEIITKDSLNYPWGYGKPEDVAWMCIYLLSDAARWITGTEFEVEGGATLLWR